MKENLFLEPEIFVDLIEKRVAELEQLLARKKIELSKAPSGRLRISGMGTGAQFYILNEKNDTNGKYLPVSQKKLARSIAQRDYDKKLVAEIETELKALRRAAGSCAGKRIEKIYDSLSVQRKKLVEPAFIPEKMYVQQWLEVEYSGKDFYEGSPNYYTENGERVRSKSEILIANMLKKFEVPYRYEFPLEVKNFGTVFPDFMCLNRFTRREFYWEHFGLMDDSEYSLKMQKKLELYALNGIFPGENLIATFESDVVPLNLKVVEALIRKYLL
ncbi:MAG: hypothetical protein KBT11_10645 [Treponema sp.]|nr:hypothetical protein [Candidatus Treponema equifaecale]